MCSAPSDLPNFEDVKLFFKMQPEYAKNNELNLIDTVALKTTTRHLEE